MCTCYASFTNTVPKFDVDRELEGHQTILKNNRSTVAVVPEYFTSDNLAQKSAFYGEGCTQKSGIENCHF
jgi:hypothetical protein